MPLVEGDVTVICPKTGEPVTVRKNCGDADGKGNPCIWFEHFGIAGNKIYVYCKYGEGKPRAPKL